MTTLPPSVLDRLAGHSCVVVGDLMLDEYLMGEVSRISPEAPVPVLRIRERLERLGGAANVARNLSHLGCEVTVVGAVGDDAAGRRVRELFADAGLATDGLRVDPARPTIRKTRVIGGSQQLLRIDDENARAITPDVSDDLVDHARARMAGRTDVLVLSDYAKGVLASGSCTALIAHARSAGVPVVVDPKGRDFSKYAGADLLTPNLPELATATGTEGAGREETLAAGARLRGELDVRRLVVTEGRGGITLIDDRGPRNFPARTREVFDVSGAGDTVMAVLAASIAGRVGIDDGCRLANLAAGVVIARLGTFAIERRDLEHALLEEGGGQGPPGVYSAPELAALTREWRARGETVVFTNGCFDLLHAGHLASIEAARREGDRLVVAINSDASVRALKGRGRPVNNEADRARVLAALAAVDAVCVFAEDTPIDVIRALRPDVLAKGADYRREDVVGADDVASWGGRVVLIPLQDGISTTELIRRMAPERP